MELDARGIARDGLAFSFVDQSAEPGEPYVYRVDVSDERGRWNLFETGAVSVPRASLALYQNSPNPFNPTTTIRFALPERCRISLDVYDLEGGLVARLAEGIRDKGAHAVTWSGRNEKGDEVSSGMYFFRLSAGKETLARKLILLR